MKKVAIKINIFIFLFSLLIIMGCKKYLDAKPDKQLTTPSSIDDLQALLDNSSLLNEKDPAASEMSSDNYYLTYADWNSLNESERRLHIWEKDFIFPQWPNQWGYAYDMVFVNNTVLDNINKFPRTSSNQLAWNNVKGQALFHRAKQFSQIAFAWSLAYDSISASTDLGIPLRLTSNFNEPSVRSNLQQTYDRIISDIKEAIQLLPISSIHVLRPSKPAAYGLLARIYLSMRKYNLAGLYADSALQLNSTLLDYNTINAGPARPFTRFNPEVVMDSYAGNFPTLTNSRAKIDSQLYRSYAENDLRKKIFFRDNSNGTFGFKGTYSGGTGGFTGIANDENYLIKAECYARAGDAVNAINNLNTLLIKRWKVGTFIPLTAANPQEALNTILLERRKELIYRSLRWMDIKRLNKEGANIILNRILNGITYTLNPNDLRYAIAIPEDIINRTRIIQNPR